MNVLQLLTKTRDLLSLPSKWVKGHLYANGGYCILGALQYSRSGQTFNEEWEEDSVYTQARTRCQMAVFEARYGEEYSLGNPLEDRCLPEIPGWNDATERDHDQIVDMLDRAIKIEASVVEHLKEDGLI